MKCVMCVPTMIPDSIKKKRILGCQAFDIIDHQKAEIVGKHGHIADPYQTIAVGQGKPACFSSSDCFFCKYMSAFIHT